MRAGGLSQLKPQGNPPFPQNPSPPCPIPRWVLHSSLRSSSFPAGSEPPEADHAFPAVFSHLGSSQAAHLVEDTGELGKDSVARCVEEALRFGWSGKGIPLLLFGREVKRVFYEDPPWFSVAFSPLTDVLRISRKSGAQDVGKWKYNALRRRQIKMETEAWERAAEEYRELQREMLEKKLAPCLPYVKSLMLGWFEPLRDAIAREQNLQKNKEKKTRASYAPYIGLLPADKMAVIVMHKMMGLLVTGQEEGCVRVVQAAVHIGEAIEHEVRIHNFLQKTKKTGDGDQHTQHVRLIKQHEILRKRVRNLTKCRKSVEVCKLLKSDDDIKSWGRDAQAKLGSCLIELLVESAFVQPPVNSSVDSPPDIRPAFRHTFRPVSQEDRKSGKRYGVIECDMLVHKGLDSTAKHMVISYMPMLIAPVKWRGYGKGGYLFLPSYIMRTHGAKQQQAAVRSVPRKQLQRVFEVPIPEKPDSEDATEMRKWKWAIRRAKKVNSEMYAQRCDTELKLSVARKMRDEEGFYYPHNLDFRGRAYPMHPHLNHFGSDICRGILEFAEGRPLGKSGLYWLKIHLANLYAGGIEKLSHGERLIFVENHIHDIIDSAEKPLDGNCWWLDAEDPLQCLAACISLSDAIKSSSPYSVISHLPIHQDGSCNGLQHYAALGRDSLGAAAVNLVAGEKPADVYSRIADRVLNSIKRDSQKDPATDSSAVLARILLNQVFFTWNPVFQVDRKLVKQTVMTSVYGVTYVGAREQIKKRLEERGLIADEKLLFRVSCYAAKVILTALEEMFQAARGIMNWLTQCAKVIASENQPVRWTSPLGLPVVQPYMKSERHLIKTSLQVLSLQRDGNSVAVRRQATAFPPNFVHSLDGSHMMMTAIACRNAGLHFAGVHDSFWTHACDVDKMNRILREQFVELYNVPILENLLENFQTSFPTLTFPALPDRGDFDLHEVLKSSYFFN